MSNERFLVIGSNSFSGVEFRGWGARGRSAEVIGVSRSPEADPVFLPYKWLVHDRFTFRQFDLNRDLDQVDATLREFQPDYVVNFAAQGMVAQSWQKSRALVPDQYHRHDPAARAAAELQVPQDVRACLHAGSLRQHQRSDS